MFSITTHNMRPMGSYSDAAQVFESTEMPTRGLWASDERPLDSPSMPHKALVYNAERGSYIGRLYQTDMVEYLKTGEVFVRSHPSHSSRKFLDRVLPEGVRCFSYKRDTWFSVCTPKGTVYAPPATLHLKPAGKGMWLILNPLPAYTRRVVNRKRAREIRASLHELVMWGRMTVKLFRGDPLVTSTSTIYTAKVAYELWAQGRKDECKEYLVAQPTRLRIFDNAHFWPAVYEAANVYDTISVDPTTPPRR